MIDASNWGSPYGFIAQNLHEVAKFYLGPSLIHFDMEDMFMNMDKFSEMPADLQMIMHMATRIYALERASTSTYASAEAVKTMQDAGVKFNALPQEDLDKAKEISDQCAEVYYTQGIHPHDSKNATENEFDKIIFLLYNKLMPDIIYH